MITAVTTLEGRAQVDSWDADEALEALYVAHWRGLVRLAVLLVGDQGVAEEVVQDAFVSTHGRWRRLRDQDKALAYLRQTVVNRSRSALRHRAVVDRHARSSSAPVDLPGADSSVVDRERRSAVIAALGALPDRQREVLVLRHFAGLSEAEIADALGISTGSVKTHASRGSARLRQLLAPYVSEEDS